MNKIKSICGLLILIIFCCCNQNINRSKNNNRIVIETERTILYHEDSAVKKSGQELFLQNLGKLIGLPNIKNGKKGLHIRIWLWGGEEMYVINILKSQLTYECQIIEFNGKTIDSSEYIVVHKEMKNLIPKSGWKNFFSEIEKYRIPTLDGGTKEVERKAAMTHAAYVQFEISQPNKYRFYEYLEPAVYRKFDANYENVHNFLEYFNSEMNVHVY